MTDELSAEKRKVVEELRDDFDERDMDQQWAWVVTEEDAPAIVDLLAAYDTLRRELAEREAKLAELEADTRVAKRRTLAASNIELHKRAEFAEHEAAELRKDAAIGEIVWHYIDRMNDIDEHCDPADKILREFFLAVMPAIEDAMNANRARIAAQVPQAAQGSGK